MVVLHVNDKLENSGGVETNIEQLCNVGPDYGLKSYWLGVYRNGRTYTIRDKSGQINLESIEGKSLKAQLAQIIEKRKVDLVHIHSISDPDLIRYFADLSVLVRSMRDPRMFCPGQGRFWRRSERVCSRKFGYECLYFAYKEKCCNRNPLDLNRAFKNTLFEIEEGDDLYRAIIVMSNYMLQEARRNGYSADKLHVNPHMTPIVPEVSTAVREGVEKRILYVGRLAREKGVHYLLKAFIQLSQGHDDIILDIVGDGYFKSNLLALIPKELTHKVFFHGWIDRTRIGDFYRNAFMVVFPSIYPEAFGISGIEAMMHGKPVVGFDVGGVSTWLKDNQTGYRVPVKDLSAMIEAMDRLLVNKEIYHNFALNARKEALANFSPDVHMNKLLQIYKGALKE